MQNTNVTAVTMVGVTLPASVTKAAQLCSRIAICFSTRFQKNYETNSNTSVRSGDGVGMLAGAGRGNRGFRGALIFFLFVRTFANRRLILCRPTDETPLRIRDHWKTIRSTDRRQFCRSEI